MSEVLLTRREGAVLVLSNNNPAARNALSPEFYAALTQALAQAQADPSVGAKAKPTGFVAMLGAAASAPLGCGASSSPSKARPRVQAYRWRWPATCWWLPKTRCSRWPM